MFGSALAVLWLMGLFVVYVGLLAVSEWWHSAPATGMVIDVRGSDFSCFYSIRFTRSDGTGGTFGFRDHEGRPCWYHRGDVVAVRYHPSGEPMSDGNPAALGSAWAFGGPMIGLAMMALAGLGWRFGTWQPSSNTSAREAEKRDGDV